MKALVTGGGGFLGRYIVEQLIAQGDEVTIFARGSYPEVEAAGATVVRGDLVDFTAVNRACANQEIVYHVASKAGYWGKWDDFYSTNVTGTENVIKACRENGINKLVYTSTPSVVAGQHARQGVDETAPYPETYASYYPHTKSIAEKMVRKANSPELRTVSLRPHIIFGPRDTQIIPRLVERGRTGKLIQVGDGSNKVDLTYVEDAARAHLLAAKALEDPNSPVAGSVYFISQDDPQNLWGFVNMLFERLGIPTIKRKLPAGVARTLGSVIETVYRTFNLKGEPRLTRFLAEEMATDHYYNISKAKNELGYQPQFTMDEAVDLTVAYFNSHKL